MRINGSIQLKLETGGGRDPETGYPLPVNVSWSKPIPCNYVANTQSNKGTYADGKFTISAFVIHIEPRKLPLFDTIRLINSRGQYIGSTRDASGKTEPDEFVLQSPPEYLETVERIKLTV